VKVGITLPQFRENVDTALEVARHAEAVGLDGVFAFDHLWPIGRPDRPALHMLPFLGALTVETERLVLGSLVARIGLFPDAVLVNALQTLARMAGEHRFVAGLGVGDRLSRAENEAFGVPFAPAAERIESLVTCCRELRAAGVPVWVGGRSQAVQEVAVAEADALNLWQSPVDEVAARRGTVLTWAGQVRPEDDIPSLLRGLRDAGATWAVCAPVGMPWSEAVESIAAAAA
jgi:alkanesulfonate monooxygenase SsuD/methylene tetrahydromethanopterin reductase-like flavin-dependent oxidoreductase (luciferase family)